MKRLLTAVILIPLVLLAIFKAPIGALAIIVAAVAILAAREFLDIVKPYGVAPQYPAVYVSFVVLFAFVATLNSKPVVDLGVIGIVLVAAAAIAPFIFLALAMRRAELKSAYPAAAASTVAFTYIGFPLVLLLQLRQLWAGVFLILYLFVVVWSGDTFAYYVGRSIGRHRMSPRVSPKKTWEGAIASLVGSAALGTYLFWHAYDVSAWLVNHRLIERAQGYMAIQKPDLLPIILLSAGLNIAAQFGDLVESAVKRGAGVKDSGAILPGHGGMLDRIDALLFAAPILWAYAALRAMA